MAMQHRVIESPIGELTLVGEEETLTGLYFPGHWTRRDRSTFGPSSSTAFPDVERQLGEYFAGTRTAFDLDLRAAGNGFQHEVWELISAIPYGETITYGALAAALTTPSHARVVGAAVGSNPLSIIVPCHRVLGKSGQLTGYAGGLDRKRRLLELEGALQPQPQLQFAGPGA
jgi:methylated-DNA-[protein]-cysteine S-methyltransferase